MIRKNELKKLNEDEISNVAGGKIICFDERLKGFDEGIDHMIDEMPESSKYFVTNDNLDSLEAIATFGSLSDAKAFAKSKGLSDADMTDKVKEFFKLYYGKN